MSLDLLLRIADHSPGRAGFGVEGGNAEELFITRGPLEADEIKELVIDILGDVEIDSANYRLKRILPGAHPMYYNLFASKVEIQGLGAKDNANVSLALPVDPFLEAEPICDMYWRYVRQAIKVSFTPRPYAILKDDSINPLTLTWTDSEEVSVDSRDSREHLRFTHAEIDPAPERVSATHGQWAFRTESEAAPNDHPFPGFPWTVVPNGQFRVVWSQVPYSLANDFTHPMHTFVGKVNQIEFMGHAPGKLLYMGAKFRPYTPHFPTFETITGSTAFSAEKLCDITFMFDYTTRSVSDRPTALGNNWIYDGWNVYPWWFTQKYYTVSAGDSANPNEWTPPYFSAPMQLLFQVVSA